MFFLVSVVKVESDKVVNVVEARQRELYYTKKSWKQKEKTMRVLEEEKKKEVIIKGFFF